MDNIAPRGKLLPIPVTPVPWRDIAMDFLTNLPTNNGSESILVVVDRFSKMIHLVPLQQKTEASDVADAFFDSVVRLHGLPATIISDRDPRF